MPGVHAAEVLLLAAVALHAGFQATVTLLVYPVLLRAEPFAPAHRRHSRAITPLVVGVYGALVAACVLRLGVGDVDPAAATAVTSAAAAVLTTALVAAPTHGRLSHGRTEVLVRRLTRADVVRTAAAATSLVAALVAALS